MYASHSWGRPRAEGKASFPRLMSFDVTSELTLLPLDYFGPSDCYDSRLCHRRPGQDADFHGAASTG